MQPFTNCFKAPLIWLISFRVHYYWNISVIVFLPGSTTVHDIMLKRPYKVHPSTPHFDNITETSPYKSDPRFPPKALLTPTLQPVRDLFATDFFATDWRSMRLVQPLYAHIRIEDYNRRLVGDRFATGLRLIGDWLP